jgi:hypothetical protein
MIERHSVTSSMIREIGYDEESETLEVEFHEGGVYQYSNIPVSVYRELISSSSIGRYFAQYIKKGSYPCRHL